MLSHAEGEQEQHFHAFGKTGVEVGRDDWKMVFAQIARDQAEVIGDSVRTVLRAQCVADVQLGKGGSEADREQKPPPWNLTARADGIRLLYSRLCASRQAFPAESEE